MYTSATSSYFESSFFFDPASGVFAQKPLEDPSPGAHQFFCPHISRQRPLLWSLLRGLGTFGSPRLSLSWSLSCGCICSLGLGLGLGLGLWPAEPETLGNAGTSTFPELGVSNVSKSTELAAAALWDLGLDLLGLDQGLDSLSTCTHGLGVVGLHLLQALLVVLLGKTHVPQELGVYRLERLISLRLGLLDAISVPFSGLVVRGVVLGLGHLCTQAHGSRSA